MEFVVFNINEEKDRLAQKLSGLYAQNIINVEEYERMLEYINKIETGKEVSIIEKIIQENCVVNNGFPAIQNSETMMSKASERHLSLFSWRTTNIKPINGSGGTFISLFGANRIIVDNLPKGRTALNVNSFFGLIEIIVSKNIKIINQIVPVLSGVFSPNEINREDEALPELHITGKAFFGNITISRR